LAADYWGVYSALTENIKKSFDAEGISIPFPQRDVHVYKHEEQ
jgi:small conductance mechanosensitive channel